MPFCESELLRVNKKNKLLKIYRKLLPDLSVKKFNSNKIPLRATTVDKQTGRLKCLEPKGDVICFFSNTI